MGTPLSSSGCGSGQGGPQELGAGCLSGATEHRAPQLHLLGKNSVPRFPEIVLVIPWQRAQARL